jgi:hypothetical protein
VKGAKWVKHLGGEHPTGSSLLSSIFLTSLWEDHVRHWRFLDRYAQALSMVERSPPYCSKIRPSPSGGPLVEIEQPT